MKKMITMLVSLTLLFLISSCDSEEPVTLSTTQPINELVSSTNVYIDTKSDAGFGLKYCYNTESMSGDVGIASENGSILLNPAYVSVRALSEDRFIARKFVNKSPHSALVDETGKEIIPFFRGEIRKINNINAGAEPILSVEPFGGKAYFTNLDAQKIFDCEFNGTGFTENGLVYGYTDNEYYMFDDYGKLLCSVEEGETEELRSISNDYAMLVKNCGKSFKFGVKNAEEREIIPCEYDEIYLFSNDRFVARIGESQSVESKDIVRVFDEKGTQLSKDGEFNSIVFNESGFGIAAKVEMGVIEPEMKYWLIDKNGKKISDEYDDIRIKENNKFYGVKNNTEIKIDV